MLKKKLIPCFMRYSNITTVHKKGSVTELENERGIFRTDIIRYILMRLIYNEKYPVIDMNMSDSQMGGRKIKGCRNNIFIINAIIHDVLSSVKKKPILLQIYDYAQMFDSIDLKQAISDIYEAGLQDDNLSLLYQANKEIFMAVNTPTGLSERQRLENIVIQGDTFGSILASVQVDSIGQECAASGYGYKYMDSLPVGILGLVDDTIGVTEVGYQAQMMNAFMNVKTAEKGLQFGAKKCKTMLVGKNLDHVVNSSLTVDKWTVQHIENKETGDTDLVETYAGQVEIGKCQEQKYLGFILSSSGDNMVNILSIRNKSIGTIRKIFTKLNSLNLQKYYFECGMILMNVMLRSSILYACETYYDLKEKEVRQLERIEESFMRQLLKTTKGCPINQLYTELGQIPARFDIIKLKLNFLKYILHQEQNSLIFKVFQLQLENPKKGDWASSCIQNLKDLDVNMSLREIKEMSQNKYTHLIRTKCEETAYGYLMKKRGKKGMQIIYQEIKMSEYLLSNEQLSIDDQRNIFAVRNKMTDIPSNFLSEKNNTTKCCCGTKEEMEHVYYCDYLSKEKTEVRYEEVYGENVNEIKLILRRFERNLDERNKHLNKKESKIGQEILDCDPLVSVPLDSGNG